MARIVTLLALLCSLPFLSHAQPLQRMEPATEFGEAIDRSRAQIEVLLAAGAPGVSIAVGVDGNLVWAEGFGYADLERKVPVSPQTRFRIGSVSKTFTSIAMARLVEDGLVDLDAPIQTWVPEYPVKERGTVTLRLIASHRSGIRHYLPDMSDNFIRDHYDDVLDALHIFADDPLIDSPGARYSYSSHAWNLLSAALQRASGKPYLSLMREQVFAPLRLTNTVADHTDYLIDNRAAAYARNTDGGIINAPYVDNSYKWAGGGFLSTPADLVRFGFGVFAGEVIEADTLQMLLQPPRLPDGSIADQNYGLGWEDFNNQHRWYGHTGDSVGGNTLFMVHPRQQVVVAIVCNLTGCLAANPDLQQIGEYFLDSAD